MFSKLLYKRFTIDIIWNVGSLVFLAAGGLIMNGIIVAFAGNDALGSFNQVYAFYIVFSQIGTAGIQHSVLKHISYVQHDINECADITTSALILVVIITLPLVILGILLAQPIGKLVNSEDVGLGLLYVMPGLLFFAINKVLINVLNGLRMMRVYAIFRSLRFIFIPLFIATILLTNQPAYMLSLALTLSEAVLFLLLVFYVYHKVLPLRRISDFKKHRRAHLSYGSRGMLSGVMIELNTRIDVLMLGLFFSDGVVGIYSFAAILAEGFAQIAIAVRYNVDPLIGEYFANQQLDKISQLSKKIRQVFVPIMIVLGIVSVLFYPLVYVVLSGEDGLISSWSVFGILVLANVMISGYSPLRGILLQGGAPGAYTLVVLATVLNNIILNLLFVIPYDVNGAALATGITIVLEMVIVIVLSQRLLGIRL